jgi:hypothetical protein
VTEIAKVAGNRKNDWGSRVEKELAMPGHFELSKKLRFYLSGAGSHWWI